MKSDELRDWWLRLNKLEKEMEASRRRDGADDEMFAWLVKAASAETYRAMERERSIERPFA